MTLATDAGVADDVEVSWQQYWFRGSWFDNLEVYWKELNTPGPFENRVYENGHQKPAALLSASKTRVCSPPASPLPLAKPGASAS